MAKKKKKKRRSELHPTLFVHEGAIQEFPDGTMLELYTQLKTEEWQAIVTETVHYKIFVDCLKNTAFPILKENWTKELDWFRLQLEVAVSRMKNLDPYFAMTINHDNIRQLYIAKMEHNAAEVVEQIKLIRTAQQNLSGDKTITNISDL